MAIVQIVGIGIVAAVLSILLKKARPEIAMLVSAAAGLVILFSVVGYITQIVELVNDIGQRAAINFEFIYILLKIIGVAYIAEFGAALCRDCGEGSIASKIEIGGKILILIQAIPIFSALLNTLLHLTP